MSTISPYEGASANQIIARITELLPLLSDNSLKAVWAFTVNQYAGNLLSAPPPQQETTEEKLGPAEILRHLGFDESSLGFDALWGCIGYVIEHPTERIRIKKIIDQIDLPGRTADMTSSRLCGEMQKSINAAYYGYRTLHIGEEWWQRIFPNMVSTSSRCPTHYVRGIVYYLLTN